MKYKKTTLSNGLRVVTVPVKGNPAVMVLVMVETGSNYETKAQSGLSHFLEHMCFKGTTKRPTASQISRELDSLGAQNNAFTGNEYTGYYGKAVTKAAKYMLDNDMADFVGTDMHHNRHLAILQKSDTLKLFQKYLEKRKYNDLKDF